MTKSKPTWIWIIPILFLASCLSPAPIQSPLDSSFDDSITSYLVEQVGITGFGGKVFCAFEYLDSEKDPAGNIYVWALCQEYYLEGGAITAGSGISLPVALETQDENGQFQIIAHRVPGDGSYYGPDVREIFPRGTWRQILPQKEAELNQYNLRASELLEKTRDEASQTYSTQD
jgi:hypothetical protein